MRIKDNIYFVVFLWKADVKGSDKSNTNNKCHLLNTTMPKSDKQTNRKLCAVMPKRLLSV